jgi:hypothetical protein
MHPVVLFALMYIVLPALRVLKVVWAIGHFLTGGVFLTRPPIERKRLTNKTFKLYLNSNVMAVPFNEVQGVPDEQPRSRTTSAGSSTSSLNSSATAVKSEPSSWMSEGGHNSRTEVRMGSPPYFNIAATLSQEGQDYLYHGYV